MLINSTEHLEDLRQVHALLESGRILMARELLEKILGIYVEPAPSPEPEAA
jgi:hypothetical protein